MGQRPIKIIHARALGFAATEGTQEKDSLGGPSPSPPPSGRIYKNSGRIYKKCI